MSTPSSPRTPCRNDAIARVRSTSSPRSRSPYKKKTIACKLAILDYLRDVANGNKTQTAEHFGISTKSIRDYIQVEDSSTVTNAFVSCGISNGRNECEFNKRLLTVLDGADMSQFQTQTVANESWWESDGDDNEENEFDDDDLPIINL